MVITPMTSAVLKDAFHVEEGEEERLDKLLSRRFPSYSRAYFQYLIQNASVQINGKEVKKRKHAQKGDLIEVTFLSCQDIDLTPQPTPLEILFEDQDLICINKPSGMVVHPSPGHPNKTFVNALLHHCRGISLPGKDYRPGIVHRLDRETSGILIAAKTPQAHQKLIEQFKERKIEKKYVAITVGHPKSCQIDAPIGRHPIRRKEMSVLENGGKKAMTIISPLKKGQLFSFISACPITGRTHQIRVHLKHHGTPILGDAVYGSIKLNEKFQISRQLLHAAQIRLQHPIKGEILNLTAPLPKDLKDCLKKFFLA